jgi:hypothetical protein
MAFDNVYVGTSESGASEFAASTFAVKHAKELEDAKQATAALKQAERTALYESGTIGGKLQYYLGEAMDILVANPITSVLTIVAMIIGLIFICISVACCGGDDNETFEPTTADAAIGGGDDGELPSSSSADADEVDDVATEDDGVKATTTTKKKKKRTKKVQD